MRFYDCEGESFKTRADAHFSSSRKKKANRVINRIRPVLDNVILVDGLMFQDDMVNISRAVYKELVWNDSSSNIVDPSMFAFVTRRAYEYVFQSRFGGQIV